MSKEVYNTILMRRSIMDISDLGQIVCKILWVM